MKIISVQDISCFGQCSLTVALPILSSRGIETAILPSGILSNHTGGFSGFTYHDLTEEMPKIAAQWEREGLRFDAIYTGYIGDARQFDIIRKLKKLLLPGGKLIVDPAMADHGRLYAALNADIVDGMRSLVREADIILPNLTEADLLLGREYKELTASEEAEDLLAALAELGPELPILTGVPYGPDRLGAAAYLKSSRSFVTAAAERMPRSFHGTGDIFSSVVIAALLNGTALEAALTEGCRFVVRCIEKTLPDETHRYGVKFEEVLAEERRTSAPQAASSI